jgi:hypothetical protein
MELNFNFPVMGLDEQPLIDVNNTVVNAGKVLANALVSQPNGDIVKYFDWAMSMFKGNDITVDSADKKKLKEFIETNNTITILLKKQLLDRLENGKASVKT